MAVSEKIRVAMIGAGAMANKVHYPSLASFDDVEIVAVCAEADPEGQGRFYADGDTQGIVYNARELAGSEDLFALGGFQAKSREFLDGVRAGELPGSHFGDALKTMEVAEKILALAALEGV